MSIEAVKTYLEPYGVAGRVQKFDVSSATVELAAQALGVEPARIAKTISLQSDGGCILVVAAGDAVFAFKAGAFLVHGLPPVGM